MPCLNVSFLLVALFHSRLALTALWTRRTERCFDDPPIGCFTIKPPYNNAPWLPYTPSFIDIHYTHVIHNDSSTFHWRHASSVMRSRFRAELKTTVIVHGFVEYGSKPWVRKLVTELASLEEHINIVVVDWRRGAKVAPFARSIANGRVVAAMGELLLKEFIAMGANASSFHIIGNSLGAHIAGDMASRVPGTGRVTGLDPSRRYTLGFGPEVRLDPTDAVFVDVIHTDGDTKYGYGSVVPIGTVDFYANGGLTQPGCSETLFNILLDIFWFNREKCSHSRAVQLFTESISTCLIRAGLCFEVDAITEKQCTECVLGEHCATFGYHVDTSITGLYAFKTGDASPFC